jgi:RNA polymerase sigma-70 factor (ECF subfamily)
VNTTGNTTGVISSSTGGSRPGAFVTTQWSQVLIAGREAPGARAALEQLCRVYWPPLYAYVRRAGYSREKSEDLTQEFFAQLLARNGVAQADPERGRFRSFLLSALKNFLANEWDRSRAQKRGGGATLLPLEFDTAENLFTQPVAPGDAPDRAFDRQWALTVLGQVLGRLRREYADSGREDLFLGLKGCLAGGRAEESYRSIGRGLGLSEGAVKVAVHRLRRRYRELLIGEITSTVAEPSVAQEELRHLFDSLGG